MLAIRNLQKLATRGGLMNNLMQQAGPAAGAMLLQADNMTSTSVYNVGQATNIKFHDGMVPRETKEMFLGQKGCVLWFTGKINHQHHPDPKSSSIS